MNVSPNLALTKATRRGAAGLLGLTLALGTRAATPHAWGAPAPAVSAAALPGPVSTPIQLADRALARASAQLAQHHPRRGVRALLVVKRQVALANTAAAAQIGKPPTDPESDDLPGPPAVLAALSLDHRVAPKVVTLFNGSTRAAVVDALRRTLRVTHVQRDALLAKVIALPAEGDRDDYADTIADTLPTYTQEVNQVSSALSTYSLTAGARTALRNALVRVRATNAKVNAVFGGGE